MGLHRWGPDAGLQALNWSWLSALSARADAGRIGPSPENAAPEEPILDPFLWTGRHQESCRPG